MDERKKRVLNAIINDYIDTAEPVGSRTITKRHDLGVSPATIRNEMSDLTDEGYIEQPHTSAGRAPTVKGYRYYVDNLMEREQLAPQQLHLIRESLSGSMNELDDFMRSCCNMISRLTNYTAIAAIPEQGRGQVENIQLVQINEWQVLAILLTSTGLVRHRLVDLAQPMDPRQLTAVEQELRSLLVGRDVRSISYDRLRNLIGDLQLRSTLAAQAMELLEHTLADVTGQRVYTGGLMNMLAQPEFHNIDKLRGLLTMLEAEDAVQELMERNSPEGHALNVTIGAEMPVESARDCSMVVTNYFINGEKAGSIGVIGPTRMSYGKTVSIMEQFAAELSRAITNNSNKEK